MDEILRQLQAMYEGDGATESSEPLPPDQIAELESMQRTKETLQQRPRERPRPETIDALVTAAAARRRPRTGADRRPVRNGSLLRPRFVGVLTMMVALGIVVVILTPRRAGEEMKHARTEIAARATPDPVIADEAIAEPDADRFAPEAAMGAPSPAKVAPPAPPTNRRATVTGASRMAATEQPIEAVELVWDQSDEVWELYQRVERLSTVSPASAVWDAQNRPALAAPVGLVQPRYASMQLDQSR